MAKFTLLFHCQSCSREWMVRTTECHLSVDSRSRCPECGRTAGQYADIGIFYMEIEQDNRVYELPLYHGPTN